MHHIYHVDQLCKRTHGCHPMVCSERFSVGRSRRVDRYRLADALDMYASHKSAADETRFPHPAILAPTRRTIEHINGDMTTRTFAAVIAAGALVSSCASTGTNTAIANLYDPHIDDFDTLLLDTQLFASADECGEGPSDRLIQAAGAEVKLAATSGLGGPSAIRYDFTPSFSSLDVITLETRLSSYATPGCRRRTVVRPGRVAPR